MRRNFLCLSVTTSLISAYSGSLYACATCLCGDPTITTMGMGKPFAGRSRAGVEYITRGEKGAEPGVNDFKTYERRIAYSFSYALTVDWVFAISLPMVTKKVERYDLSMQQGSGRGDIDLSARWVLGKDRQFASRYLWGVQFGLRLPTSEQQAIESQVIDIDAQPGVGATVPSLGLWYGRYANPWFLYGSFAIQHATSEGYQGYQAGDVLLLTAMSQYAMTNTFAIQVGFDGRYKRYDYYRGERDPNSGGVLVMGSPGLVWTALEDLVINFKYQIPLRERPHGYQEEERTLRWGASYDF